ncbi:penicillin-binding protein [Nocardioides speluncae]|uniref:penicillin-binding protein n=1 Tax=Nocardioides speluncae TaxID=2670337 RepID=UPI000D68835B|nr:transglycosylase domain-containing protein [Nocardioides speluncae]
MSLPESERLSASRIASHIGVMLAVAAVLGVVVAGLAIPFAGVLGLGARNVADSMDSLPAELEAKPLPQKTKILDGQGNVLATLYDENRVNVSLKDVSKTMVKAIVAIEDYRFYQHGALDLKGTLRAFITNQADDSGSVQGGSSITQQMVKQTLLTQAETKEEKKAATERTMSRKIRELRYAIAFEEKYSKDWILERYLNIAYFGDGAYGIQAAARHYFSKNASKLNLRESAMLAGMVKNPTGYDPTNYESKTTARRNLVLDRLAELNVITEAQAEETKAIGLGLKLTRAKNGCVESRAPFFCDYVVQYLEADRSLGKTIEERRKLLKTGGLVIRTTVDLRFQKAADDSVRDHVYPTDQAIGALAMVEPRTGNVKAISQSRPMGRKKAEGESYLNYVVNSKYGDSNGFQPGSTFKSFVLAAAINQGIPLNTQIASPPEVFMQENEYKVCNGENYASSAVWDPNNSTDSGTFNLYTGTQKSVNTFFAQLEQRTGLCEPYTLAKRMGIELTDPTHEMVPSFTLGVADVSPLEMAEAYSTFAGRGVHCSARPVTSIEDTAGHALKKYRKACTRVIPAAVADAVNDILRGVQEPGGFGYGAGISLVQPSAGKTGTTNDNKAVWFAGYTPHLATASMIAGANFDGQPITLNGQSIGGSYISSAYGSTVAGPQWGDAMKVIEQWLPDDNFVTPDATQIQGVLTQIPDVVGMSIDSATAALKAAGFNVSVGPSVNSKLDKGLISSQDPSGYSEISAGTTVVIYPSNGTPPKPPCNKRPKWKCNRDNNDGGDNDGGGDRGGNDRAPIVGTLPDGRRITLD